MTTVTGFYHEKIVPALRAFFGRDWGHHVVKAPTPDVDHALEIDTRNRPKQFVRDLMTRLARLCKEMGAAVRRRKGGSLIVVEFQAA